MDPILRKRGNRHAISQHEKSGMAILAVIVVLGITDGVAATYTVGGTVNGTDTAGSRGTVLLAVIIIAIVLCVQKKSEMEKQREREEKQREREEKQMREQLKEIRRAIADMEEIVKEYKIIKLKTEGHLRELNKIADELDRVNRNANIAKTAGSSINAFGGVMTIAGLALAPVTVGASSVFAIGGIAAGTAGGATNITTEVTQSLSDGKDKKRAKEIWESIQSKMIALERSVCEAFQILSKLDEYDTEYIWNFLNSSKKCFYEIKNGCKSFSECVEYGKIIKDGYNVFIPLSEIPGIVKTMKILKADPALKQLAKQVTGLSSEAAKRIPEAGALKGTLSKAAPVALSKKARIAGGAVAGAFVLWDVYEIIKITTDIRKGSLSETAKQIRKQVKTVKLHLSQVEEVYSAIDKALRKK